MTTKMTNLTDEMPRRRVAKELEAQAIRLRLHGYTRDEISEKLGISAGTVSKILKNFESLANREGIEMAAGEYGVEDDVAFLIDLAIQLRKHNLTPAEAKAGARLLKRLQSLGIDEKDLETYTNRLYLESKKTGRQPRELIQAAQRLLTLEKETNKTYQELLSEYENLAKEEERLKESIQNLRQELDQMLREKKVTSKLLEEYVKIRDQLSKHGLEIRDLDKALTFLQNLREYNYNIKTILEGLMTIKSLREEKDNLGSQVNALEKELNNLKNELTKTQLALEKNKLTIQRLQELEKLGLNYEKLLELTKLIREMAISRGLDPKQTVEGFFTDIKENYDRKLGLEKELNELEEKIKNAKLQLTQHQDQLDGLKEKYAELSETIESIQQLRRRGIKTANIIAWNRILASSKVKPEDLEKDLQQYSNLRNLLKEKDRELSDLERKLKETEMKLSELEKQKTALETTINDTLMKLNEKVNQLITHCKGEITATAKSANMQLSQLSQKAAKTISDAKNKFMAELENARSRLKALEDEIEELTIKAYEVGETIGKYEAIKPFLEFISTGEGKPHTVIPNMISILEQFRAWIRHRGSPSLGYLTTMYLDSLIKDLKEALTRGYE